jgi:hypothetical protein
MGTASAWGGSGGREWGQVRRDAADLTQNPSQDAAGEVVDGLLDALDADEPQGQGQPQADALPQPALPPLPIRRRPAGSGGGGAVGGGGGLVFRRPSSGGGGKGGSRRSRAAASSAAGSVIAAGLAVRRGDADTLAGLGLDLAELQALNPFKQGQKILNVLIGSGAAVEESELRQANAPALRRILTEDLDATEAVRVFLVEYAMQIFDSEVGEAMRDGSRSGDDSLRAEREVRSAVTMRVELIDLPADALSPTDLAAAINTALETMRKVRPS